MTRINISPYRVVRLLMFIVVGFTLIHCILQVLNFGLGLHKITLITTLFDFERDANITTWYSSTTLFISSLLLTPIAIAKKNAQDPYTPHWQILAVIFALAYLKFLAHLPTKTRNLFILAGALYIGGALGLEIMAGHQESLDTYNELLYKLFTTLEELWEKLGVLVFIYALLTYMEKYVHQIQIFIGNNSSSLPSINLPNTSGVIARLF